ncbi:hypothetical protein LI82_11515 [Methanococcoides methylutens]|uniref:Uncharacterized protein n=1 Tax=Methanococcoides methylutens TaxID=2226 RepID=A0A099T271_METMT|nr:hypothetical protein LI82_11515 [Methanococcoides methylutens]
MFFYYQSEDRHLFNHNIKSVIQIIGLPILINHVIKKDSVKYFHILTYFQVPRQTLLLLHPRKQGDSRKAARNHINRQPNEMRK